MPPHLRVLAGPSPSALHPITHLVNTPHAFHIASDRFEGDVVVNIKGLAGPEGEGEGDGEYFAREERRGITWSIQVRGRFLCPVSADDVLFGNTFDRPLSLPWGSSAALKFMHYIDPTLEHDLMSTTKPWALSPLVATMPHLAHTRVRHGQQLPPFPPHEAVEDDTSQLHLARGEEEEEEEGLGLEDAAQRRAYFSNAEHRRRIMFKPEDVITTDFCYGFLEFSPALALRLPGGVSFDLMRYWDGQPVRFVCCERGGEEAWGEVFWCVVIEMAEEDVGID